MKEILMQHTFTLAMAASMLFGCASESKTETTAAAGETTAAAAETTAEAAKADKTAKVKSNASLLQAPSAIRHSTTPHRLVWKSLRLSLAIRLK